MKHFLRGFMLAALVALWPHPAAAQQFILSDTTSSAAQTATAQTITLTSITANVSTGSNATVGAMQVGWYIYIDGEAEAVLTVPTSGTTVTVRRGQSSTPSIAHVSGAVVIFGPAGDFFMQDPWQQQMYGGRTCNKTLVPQPFVNLLTGDIWLCRSSLWTATNPLLKTWNSSTLTP